MRHSAKGRPVWARCVRALVRVESVHRPPVRLVALARVLSQRARSDGGGVLDDVPSRIEAPLEDVLGDVMPRCPGDVGNVDGQVLARHLVDAHVEVGAQHLISELVNDECGRRLQGHILADLEEEEDEHDHGPKQRDDHAGRAADHQILRDMLKIVEEEHPPLRHGVGENCAADVPVAGWGLVKMQWVDGNMNTVEN